MIPKIHHQYIYIYILPPIFLGKRTLILEEKSASYWIVIRLGQPNSKKLYMN